MDDLIRLLGAFTHLLLWPTVLGLFALLGWSAFELGAFLREGWHRRAAPGRLAATTAALVAADDRSAAMAAYELRLARRVARDAFVARLAPMLGLAGTLIPLGPALADLRGGDLAAFAQQLAVAFSTTVAGIVVCALAYWLAGVRGRWYEGDLRSVERALEAPARGV